MNELPSSLGGNEENKEPLWKTVDEATRTRAGSLAAHGLNDYQLVDVLLLTYEQVISVKESVEYRAKYAEVADAAITQQLTMAEGWDAIEEEAIKKILTTMQYNSDPKYALAAAQIANKAERRRRIKDTAPVIDASKAGGNTTNVIILKMNRNFISVQEGNENTRTIDAQVVNKNDVPRKLSDLPNPKQVEEILSKKEPVAEIVTRPKRAILKEIEKYMDVSGVAIDINDDE